MDAHSLLILVIFGAANFGAAAVGAIFRPGDWYKQLDKPRWRPPDRLFAPVWTVLYAMIAVSGWLVWREAGFAGAAWPFAVYLAQLLLNAGWTPIFFGLRRPDLALAEIAVLWASIAGTIVLFYPVSPAGAWLLAPYLAWVSFAFMLNFSIWRRNSALGVRTGT